MNLTRCPVLRLGVCFAAFFAPLPVAAQFGQITFPDNGSVVSGTTVISAQQLMTSIDPNQIGSVRFEYSIDGVSWILIGIDESPGNSAGNLASVDWLWDTTTVASGTYRLRARFQLSNGLILGTPFITVTVNLPPLAVASGDISSGLLARLDATASADPDGSIVAWDWDFGDGTTGTGSAITHPYALGIYVVTLTVTDSRGAQDSDYLEVLATAAPAVGRADTCTPTDIQLRRAGQMALGNDGKSAGWPISTKPGDRRDDGKTLGPLSTNPGNKDKANGYAFEILAKVDGVPSLCKEIQLIKATNIAVALPNADDAKARASCMSLPGGGEYNATTKECTSHTAWTGSATDFDGDGTVDLDLSTREKCLAQRGTWNDAKKTCVNAVFAQAKDQYKPDEDQSSADAYRSPYTYKVHLPPAAGQLPPQGQILWYDAPHTYVQRAGTRYSADFVAIVRASDQIGGKYKYCYVAFNLQYEVGKADSENATVTKMECDVDKTKVPGLR